MIGLIDLGVGNLFSLMRGLSQANLEYKLLDSKCNIFDYESLILPGVGAFEPAINVLNKSGIGIDLKKFSNLGGKIVGICLGMQLLLDESLEFGKHKGLGLISGRVRKIPVFKNSRIPNIGWNQVHFSIENDEIFNFKSFANKDFYFAHSFYCDIKNKNDLVAYIEYDKMKIPVIIKNKNVFGIQFHPEMSDLHGLELIKSIF